MENRNSSVAADHDDAGHWTAVDWEPLDRANVRDSVEQAQQSMRVLTALVDAWPSEDGSYTIEGEQIPVSMGDAAGDFVDLYECLLNLGIVSPASLAAVRARRAE